MSKNKNNPVILEAAMALAWVHGYRHVTREMIAKLADVATGTVSLQMGTMRQLRRTVVRYAIRTNNQKIIAQAITNEDPLVKKLSEDQRVNALMSVA